mmetsp:Transcript_11349/g.47416  ORF Transcript_11349/g.47416 Transcript_11349/m.47416 type:complete len:339 (+) Transcript_11349:197-1213(+)
MVTPGAPSSPPALCAALSRFFWSYLAFLSAFSLASFLPARLAAFICFSHFSYALLASRRRISYMSSNEAKLPRYWCSCRSCRWMMSVVIVLRKSRSCDTTTSVFFHVCRYSSSHSTARRSRWLVGSSSSSSVGWMKSARARLMRMRQPPEKLLVGAACILGVKPRPCRILRARLSAFDESKAAILSYTSARRSAASSGVSCSSSPPPAAPAAASFFAFLASRRSFSVSLRSPAPSACSPCCSSPSAAPAALAPSSPPAAPASAVSLSVSESFSRRAASSRSCMSSISASSTAWMAERSSPITSCSTSSTSMCSGTGIMRLARRRSSVDLPMPLGPHRP